MTLDDVDTFARSLPGVRVGTKWRHKTWMVGDKGFAWERPLGKTDIARFGDTPPPAGPIVAVRAESLDAKDGLLALDLPGFFTITHFNNYPALLIALRKARASDVRAAIRHAHAAISSLAPRKRAATRVRAAIRKAKGTASSARRKRTARVRAALRDATSSRAKPKVARTRARQK